MTDEAIWSGEPRVATPGDFVRQWRAGLWCRARDGRSAEVAARVAVVLDRVRSGGHGALLELTAELDGPRLSSLAVPRVELEAAAEACPAELRRALVVTAERIQDFSVRAAAGLGPQLVGVASSESPGITEAWLPLRRAGIYAPGGRAPYPSSVLMTALPARAAGVREIVLCTPPRRDGTIAPVVAAAALTAGVDRVFRLGGAQAVAAMAWGVGEVPRVDKVAGPGNAYVTEAKRQLYGQCGFDGLAGPSEVVAVGGRPGCETDLAWQLLAQAEHGPDSLAVGVVMPGVDAGGVLIAIEEGLRSLPADPAAAAAASLRDFGALVTADDAAEALQVIEAVCPEHAWIELTERRASRGLAFAAAQYVGAVYVGDGTPVAFGDYAAGPSHVLPTGGSARWGSPLGPADFMRRVSIVECAGVPREILAAAHAIATAEGFAAHAITLERAGGECT